MKHENTTGIILGRINFGEADRILTVITPNHGKLRLMAKGVRKEKSKLAGGVELFSVSQISFIPGKRDISTLVSSRLLEHFGHIIKELERTMLGYELLKVTDKQTEDECEAEYYDILRQSLDSLNDLTVSKELVEVWFLMRLITLKGHQPNLETDSNNLKLEPGKTYQFDYSEMTFTPHAHGSFKENDIKFLRLLTSKSIRGLNTISGVEKLAANVRQTLKNALDYN